MSTAVKEKKPFLPQRKPQVEAGGGAVALRGGSVPRPGFNSTALTIGGEPRVHLLPVEVQERAKAKEVKRRLLFLGVLVVAIVAFGYGLATIALTGAQSQLSAAKAATSQLLVEQSKYGAVTKVNSDIAAIGAAQKTTTAQEILWAPYLSNLEATLPGGAAVTAVNATMDTPFGSPPVTTPATTTPLEGPRIATVQLTVSIPQADIPGWLNTLPSIKGFVDATPGSVTAPTNGGSNYSLVVTIHMNSAAVSHRFGKTAGATK